jgi:electron transfer flavoprotein alpha subunit
MRTIVFVKAVPDVAELKFDPGKKTLARTSVMRVLGFDRRAVEEALLLREKHGGTVSVVTMGPPSAEETLKPLIAMGADSAVLLTDPAFAEADTLATAATLALAAKKMGFDLILAGQRSIDSDTGQLIPELAQLLGTSLATAVNKEDYADGKFTIERESEEGYELLELKLPATMSVTERINRPRQPTPEAIEKSKQAQVARWSAADLGAQTRLVGAAGSMTEVRSIREESYKRSPVIIDGTKDLAPAVAKALEAVRGVLRERPGHRDLGAVRAKTPKPVWVVFLRGSVETETGLETLSKVRQLGLQPVAVMVGSSDDDAASAKRSAVEAGALSIVTLKTEEDGARSSAACAGPIVQAVSSENPYALLLPSTVLGREVAGRVAAALGAGLTGDATELLIDENDELVQVKPAFGGNLVAEVVSKKAPRMATVRPGVWDATRLAHGPVPETVIQTSPTRADVRVLSRRTTVDYSNGDVSKGRVVIGVGSGVGSTEAFEGIRKFAAGLGIPVVGTRKLIDSGWAPPQFQVGLTGRHVMTDLYVAIAVSGAAYHLVGIKKARVIFAVNSDPNAPIFKVCDVGLIGDYKAALPLMAEQLRAIAETSRDR